MLPSQRVGRLLDALSRKTTSGRFIPEIDGLRFVAIALVVLGHLRYFLEKQSGAPYAAHLGANTFARIVGRGWIGVQIFFAISGFILALPFAAAHLRGSRHPSLRAYFLRRVTRLEPPYLLALGVFFWLRVTVQHASSAALIPHLAASCGYLHNVVYGTASTVLGVAWSLEVEVQFYVLVPLLAQIFKIRSRTTRRLVIAGTALIFAGMRGFLLPTHNVYAELTILGHLQFFLAGFVVADLFLTEWNEHPSAALPFDVVALVALSALLLDVPRSHGASTVVFPIAVFLIAYGAFRGRACRLFLRNPYVSTIGGMCYSIYLLHFPLITETGLAVRRWIVYGGSFGADYARLALVILPLVLVASALYFILIERPCMERDWPQRLCRRIRALRSA